jgi:predicted TPR repeat methyltransferase
MAAQWHARGELEAAADLMAQVRDMAPHWPAAAFRHGEILMAAGRRDDAVAAFTACLALDPADRHGAVIKLSLLGAMKQPAALPPDYVAQLFDDYAPRFEKHLVEGLCYSVPQKMADLVEELYPVAATGAWRILDCGCGTGLCGDWFSRRAGWLEGIDLSAGMIAEAARKGQYQALRRGDMLAMLETETRSFELVLAADVLIYTGALERIFAAVTRVLAPGGLFVFSVQMAACAAYHLGGDHRFGHSRAYVENCAVAQGLTVQKVCETVLRQDAGSDVPGLIMVLRRPGTDRTHSAAPDTRADGLPLPDGRPDILITD